MSYKRKHRWYLANKAEHNAASAEYYARHADLRKKQVSNRIRLYLERIDYIRRNGCIQCGCARRRVLDFHHARGTKKFDICKAVNRGFAWKRISDEISKCEVLCANCHRVITAREQVRRGFLVCKV